MAAQSMSNLQNTLSTPSVKIFSIADVNIAQVVLEIVIIIAIRLERVQTSLMQRLVNILISALWLETILIGSYSYVLHGLAHVRLAVLLWNCYKIVRLFVQLSMCYPIIVLTNKPIKLHLIFLFLSSLIMIGSIIDCTSSQQGSSSGYNNFAFMLIFLFTFYQYYQLRCHIHYTDNNENQGHIKGLKSLMAIELALICLNGLFLILFFSGNNHLLQALRLSMTLVQYLKIYVIMSLFASLHVHV